MSYTYTEFPLWVEHEKGERKIVDSQEAFEALGEGWKKPDSFVTPGFGPGRVMVEYPKWIGDVLVNSQEEEDALHLVDDEDSTQALVGDADIERRALYDEAKAMGLNPHSRTGTAKLREMIAAADKA